MPLKNRVLFIALATLSFSLLAETPKWEKVEKASKQPATFMKLFSEDQNRADDLRNFPDMMTEACTVFGRQIRFGIDLELPGKIKLITEVVRSFIKSWSVSEDREGVCIRVGTKLLTANRAEWIPETFLVAMSIREVAPRHQVTSWTGDLFQRMSPSPVDIVRQIKLAKVAKGDDVKQWTNLFRYYVEETRPTDAFTLDDTSYARVFQTYLELKREGGAKTIADMMQLDVRHTQRLKTMVGLLEHKELGELARAGLTDIFRKRNMRSHLQRMASDIYQQVHEAVGEPEEEEVQEVSESELLPVEQHTPELKMKWHLEELAKNATSRRVEGLRATTVNGRGAAIRSLMSMGVSTELNASELALLMLSVYDKNSNNACDAVQAIGGLALSDEVRLKVRFVEFTDLLFRGPYSAKLKKAAAQHFTQFLCCTADGIPVALNAARDGVRETIAFGLIRGAINLPPKFEDSELVRIHQALDAIPRLDGSLPAAVQRLRERIPQPRCEALVPQAAAPTDAKAG